MTLKEVATNLNKSFYPYTFIVQKREIEGESVYCVLSDCAPNRTLLVAMAIDSLTKRVARKCAKRIVKMIKKN